MQVTACAPLRPTEVPERVQAAVTAWIDGGVNEVDGHLVATGTDLIPLRQRIWELKIIDTFRGQWMHGLHDDGQGATVRLSKQAAASAIVSFPASPHALGELVIDIRLEPADHARWPDAEALGWWLAPETEEGRIVGPMD